MINKKTIKIIFISIVVFMLLVVGAVALFVATIDTEVIKKKAIEAVYNRTNRELKINGDVNWTFFPWLGIKVEDVSLSNASDFKSPVPYFAKARVVEANIKLLPLVFRRFEIGNLILKGFDLQLIKNESGKNNWQDLLAFGGSTQPDVTRNNSFDLTNFIIRSITIDDGSVFWLDQQANRKVNINKFNLYCKNVSFKQPFNVDVSFYLDDLVSFLAGEVAINTRVVLDGSKELLEFKPLQLSGRLKNKTTEKFFDFDGKTNIKFDLKKQSFLAEDIKLNIAGMIVSGLLGCSNIISSPSFSGNLSIVSSDSASLIQLLGIDEYFKKTANARFKTEVLVLPKLIRFQNIEMQLHDMILRGNAGYASDKVTFDVSLNKLDFDMFASSLSKPAASSQAKRSMVSGSNPSPGFLQTTKLEGDLKIGNIQFDRLYLTNFTTKIIGSNGLMDCQKIKFDFYQGRAFGNAHVNIKTSTPNIDLKLALESVSMKTMLMSVAKYEKFSGVLALNTNINVNSLSGDGGLVINRGSYHGVDIPYEIRRAHAVLNAKPMPSKSSPPRTDFDQLTMSFKINNGLLNTNNLLIQAPDYKITGQGNANLLSKNLNLSLSAYSLHDENFFVPVKVTGSFENPSVSFDAAVMLKHAIKKAVKDVIVEQVEKHMPKLPEGLKNVLPF